MKVKLNKKQIKKFYKENEKAVQIGAACVGGLLLLKILFPRRRRR